MAFLLRSTASPFRHLYLVKVDRICTGREVTGNDIKVSAEPHVGEVRDGCLALPCSALPHPMRAVHVVLCVDCCCLESSQGGESLDVLGTGLGPQTPSFLQSPIAHAKLYFLILLTDFAQVVILQPPPMAPLPAFAGDNVKVPMTYGEANYFCRRKITMVNGMHTTLAFLTLCRSDTWARASHNRARCPRLS